MAYDKYVLLIGPAPESPSEGRASLLHDPGGSRASGQRANITVGAESPPLGAIDVLRLECKEEDDAEEGNPGIQACSEDVVVPRPPALVFLVQVQVEEQPDDHPRGEVQGPCWRHVRCGRQDQWHVDVLRPPRTIVDHLEHIQMSGVCV